MASSACSAVVTLPTPTSTSAPNVSMSRPMPSTAPGTVIVTSVMGTPPLSRAFAMSVSTSADLARTTGTMPTSQSVLSTSSRVMKTGSLQQNRE